MKSYLLRNYNSINDKIKRLQLLHDATEKIWAKETLKEVIADYKKQLNEIENEIVTEAIKEAEYDEALDILERIDK